jgi:hypothetical protein
MAVRLPPSADESAVARLPLASTNVQIRTKGNVDVWIVTNTVSQWALCRCLMDDAIDSREEVSDQSPALDAAPRASARSRNHDAIRRFRRSARLQYRFSAHDFHDKCGAHP